MRPIDEPYMHEDELPEDITDDEYDAWYATSFVPDGVGCRVGPVFRRSGITWTPDPPDQTDEQAAHMRDLKGEH